MVFFESIPILSQKKKQEKIKIGHQPKLKGFNVNIWEKSNMQTSTCRKFLKCNNSLNWFALYVLNAWENNQSYETWQNIDA